MSTMSIPAFHVSDQSIVKGSGDVFIQSRKDAASTGIFSIKLNVHFDPLVDLYPAGSIFIKTDLNDGAKGDFKATSVELINSYGKANPTAYITGRCDGDVRDESKGYRYWILIANNSSDNKEGSPDIAGFAVHDRSGKRIAYGIGPVKGDFIVKAE